MEETTIQGDQVVNDEKAENVEPQAVTNDVSKEVVPKKSSNKGLFIALGCIVILVVLFVCGIIFVLFGATFTAINPSETFKDARNVRKEQDVDAITAGLRQYLLRDLNDNFSLIVNPEYCNLPEGLAIIDPYDGISPNEGLPVETLSACLSDYISGLPTPVDGSSYRWGVDNLEYPAFVYVGVDSMEALDGVPVTDYYGTIDLYSY
jgi:hypothetical protein